MKLAKPLGIGIGIIMVIIIALLLAMPHFVHLESFRPRIEEAATKALKREVKVEGLRLQFFPGFGAGLSKLSVADRAGFGTGPLISTDDVDVSVSILGLLRNRIVVKKISLVKPRIMMVRDKNGEFSIGDLYKKSEEKPAQEKIAKQGEAMSLGGRPLTIAGVQIKDGLFIFDDYQPPSGGHVVNQLENFDLTVKNLSLTEPVKLSLAFGFKSGKEQNFKLEGKAGPLGENLDWKNAPVDLTMDITKFDLGAVLPYFADKLPVQVLSGMLSAQMRIRPEGKGLAAKGTAGLDDFSYMNKAKGWPASKKMSASVDTDAMLSWTEKKYSLQPTRINMGKSVLDLSGEMDGEKYNFKFKSDNLDLSEVADLVYPLKKLMADRGLVLAGPMALDGSIHAASPAVLEANLDLKRTEIKYPGTLNKPAGDKFLVKIVSKKQSADSMLEDLLLSFNGGDLIGQGTLSKDYDLNLGLSGKDISMEELAKLVEPLSSYNLRGKMNLNGTLYGKLTNAALLNFNIERLTMVGQDLDLALNGEVNNLSEPNIKFNLEGQKLDVAGLMKPGPGAKVKKKAADPPDRSDPTAGHKSTLERIRLEGRIKLGQISYAPYQLSNFDSGFNMKDGVASLPDSAFGIFNGTAKGPVSVDLKGKKPKYQGNLALAGVDMPALLKNFTSMADKLEGKMDGNLAFAGKGTSWEEIAPNLVGNGKLTVAKGSLKGFNLVGSLLGDWAKSSQFQSLVQSSVTPSQWQSLRQTDFNSIQAVFELKDGGLDISDLSMLIPDGKVSGKGRVGFDAKTKMAGLLLLDEIPSKQIAKQMGLSPQVVNVLFSGGKNLLLPFLMTGSFPSLAVLLDPTQYGNIMGNNMKGSLTNLNNLDLNSLFNPKSGASQGSTAKSGAKSKNKSKSNKSSGSSDLQKEVEKGVGDLLQGLNPKP